MPSRKRRQVGRTLKRSSRRNQDLHPQAGAESPSTLYLPTELKIDVLKLLEKRYLKMFRLVSKDWCSLATEFLFDKAYISPRKKDMEIFENITQHPVLRSAVKELVYDASHFRSGMSRWICFKEVKYNLISVLNRWRVRNEVCNSPDKRLNAFLEALKGREITRYEIYQKYKDESFLVEGHRLFQELARYEQLAFESGIFYTVLCCGLRQLDRLRSVVLSNKLWGDNLNKIKTLDSQTLRAEFSGSPLTRSWNPLHPLALRWTDSEDGRLNGSDHFFAITRAISETHRKISSFMIAHSGSGGLPPSVLIGAMMRNPLSKYTIDAFSGLEVLDITISANREDEPPPLSDIDNLPVLPCLLKRMLGLKRLKLCLLERTLDYLNTDKFQSHGHIFPLTGVWPNLTYLSISGLSIRAFDFLCLIYVQTPNLCHLEIYGIQLLEGHWEGMLEGMRRRRLRSFTMSEFCTNVGGTPFRPRQPEDRGTDSLLVEAIENYVVYGGRHPCLPPEMDALSAGYYHLAMYSESSMKELGRWAHIHGISVEQLMGCKPIEKNPYAEVKT
ncbi:hypothetical protein MMC28_002978 [Mycoblastus sanguinarius]|nr:hypothetical protein [Mycoblastus sanguinarius]